MLSAELPAEPPSLLGGGLPLFCCPVPPPDDTVGVAPGVAESVGLTVGVSVLSVGIGEGVAEGEGDGVAVGDGEGVGEGVGDGVGVGVARQLQDTLTLLFCPLKVIVALAGQGVLAGIVMATFTWPRGCSIPPAGLMVIFGTPWLLATQMRFLLGLTLLTVTKQCLQFASVVGETATVPPGASGRMYGAASATGERRANNGTKIARAHRAAKAMNTDSRENPEALRGDIALSSLALAP